MTELFWDSLHTLFNDAITYITLESLPGLITSNLLETTVDWVVEVGKKRNKNKITASDRCETTTKIHQNYYMSSKVLDICLCQTDFVPFSSNPAGAGCREAILLKSMTNHIKL